MASLSKVIGLLKDGVNEEVRVKEIRDLQGNKIGGNSVEFRSDDPDNPEVGKPWYNTTDDVLRLPYDDNGEVKIREVRSVFSEAGVRVVEDFEGQTISNLEALAYVTADQQIAEQNGSDRLEITAAPSEIAGVYWSGQTDEVAATAYIPDENSTAGVIFTDTNGNSEFLIIPDLAGAQAPEPSIALFDQINNQPIDTVAVTPSNWIGGDAEFSLRLDGDGNVIGEVTDINGDTTTLSGSAPAGLSKGGYGVLARKFGGSGESKVYIDDIKAFAEGQEVSPALSEYARIDAVPDAYINSGEGVTDNGSGLEVVESELDHDSLNNYESEEHHPVFVQSSVGEAEQIQDAIWVDISQSPPEIKRWNGSGWESTGAEPSTHDNTAHSETYALASDAVSDHANLTNVQTDQHHTRPSAGTGITEDGSNTFDVDESNVDHDSLDNYHTDEHRSIIIDTEANRPGAGGFDTFFYAEDTQKLYHDYIDGVWRQITVEHSDVKNILPDDHHVRPSAGDGLLEDANNDFNVDNRYRLIFTDTEANRPAGDAPNANIFFYATDTQKLYRNNGTSWEQVTVDHADINNINTDDHHTRPSAGTGLSEGTSNNFRAGETPTDLSGTTGDFDGQIRIDDGTNTSNRGIMCVWDDTNSEWVPQDGGSTFT